MRLLQLLACADSSEGYKSISQKLTEDYGEPIIKQRSGIIPMEDGAWEKLKRLHGNV